MVDVAIWALLALSVVAVLSLLVLLLRKPRFETPAELTVWLGMLEQALQTLSQSSTRNEAGIERMESRQKEFSVSTAQLLEASRKTLDDKLEKTIEESRSGRQELLRIYP